MLLMLTREEEEEGEQGMAGTAPAREKKTHRVWDTSELRRMPGSGVKINLLVILFNAAGLESSLNHA